VRDAGERADWSAGCWSENLSTTERNNRVMRRRNYLQSAGVGVAGLGTAGCVSVQNTGDGATTATTNASGTTGATTGATTTATLPDEYAQYAYEPAEPVTFTYDELVGNIHEWTEAWAQQVATN
jgi:hypothetical protein